MAVKRHKENTPVPFLWLFSFLRGLFRSLLFFQPRTNQRVHQTVIPFVAGVFEQWTDSLLQRQLCSPGSAPCRLVLNCELILNRFSIGPRETLDDTQIFARASERILSVEIHRFYNEGIALPAAPGITGPLTYISRNVWTPIHRNNPDVVCLLEQDHDVSRRLDNLIIAVV